ncbi:MAG: PEP-utilizing enzyme, partial [Planctomycetota bacterium]|nr:PEP-utilizing enzyme [Planctomycetota bacterium]
IEQWRQPDPAAASDEQLLSGVRALTIADVMYWFRVRRVVGVSKFLEMQLNIFLRKYPPESGSTTIVGDSGMFIGGFTSKTAQAQADLAAIAKQIRAEEKLYKLVVVTPAERLLDTLRKNADGRPLIGEIEHYLDKYGHMVYTLDYAEPTPADAPLPVLMSLKALVQGTGYDPIARQTESARNREASVKEASKLFGPLQRWKFRWRVWLARYYGRHREEALFFIGAAWAVLRPLALELGRRLVEVGTLASADDVFYLTSEELEEAIQARKEEQALPDYIQKAADQRELREARKRIHPPGKIPPEADKSFVESFRPWELDAGARLSLTVGGETQILNEEGSDTLKGFAVSRGQVTAEASVIISPADFAKFKPGSILVCEMATSAWTQLFPLAKGLVTDIGGMNAHGSIVAREYGIPAVMGTGNITKRIVSGQLITVDGDAGTVALLQS